MEVSEIDHFKRVQAAKGVHGSDSITGPTQFWLDFSNMIFPIHIII